MKNTLSPSVGTRRYNVWLLIHTLGLLMIFSSCMLAPAAPYHWDIFYKYIYRISAVLLMAFYIWFRRGSGSTEARLCFYFCLWALVSRLLNGDMLLSDGDMVLNITVSCLFMPLCSILPEKNRGLLLDVFSLLLILFTLAGAILGLYCFITESYIVNPLSQWYVCTFDDPGRLYLFECNPNTVGSWLLCGSFMLIYEFIKRKNLLLRGLCLLGIITEYLALSIASSRNSMLGYSVCMAALVLLVLLRRFRIKKPGLKALSLVLCLGVIAPLCYMSFNESHKLLTYAENSYYAAYLSDGSYEAYLPEHKIESADELQVDEMTEGDYYEAMQYYTEVRGFADTGRLPIYKSALQSIREEPLRLIRGSMSGDIMRISDKYLESPAGHFHNSFLQALEYTGLIGLGLVLAFFVLLTVRAWRLFFTEDSRAGLAVKALVLPLPGMIIYNMLETSAFHYLDLRSLCFFIIAGAVIAYSREICPFKKELKAK